MSDVTLKGLAVSPDEVLRVPFLVETWQAWPEFAGPRGYAGDTSYRGAVG